MSSSNKIINRLGEFSDRNLEDEYFEHDIKKSGRFIKPMVLVLGILNTLFIIPDYLTVSGNEFIKIALSRFIFLLLVICLYMLMDKIKNSTALTGWITGFEVLGYLLFLYILYQYEAPNFLIQAMGTIVIIVVVFIMPNRFVHMIAVSFFVCFSFLSVSVHYIKYIKTTEFLACAVYITVIIFLCAIMAYRNQYNKRIQYVHGKELEVLSTTDYLTKTYNRVKLENDLIKRLEYSKLHNKPLSLIIIDLDDFKQVNDTFGHLFGDHVIVELAFLIRDNIRENDILARWGGDEFIIILPDQDKAQAVNTAERIRQKISSNSFKGCVNITCSFGVVEMISQDDFNGILHRADLSLYMAKQSGKNTVKG